MSSDIYTATTANYMSILHGHEKYSSCIAAYNQMIRQCMHDYKLVYLSNGLRFSVRVYCNNAQMTSERVKN